MHCNEWQRRSLHAIIVEKQLSLIKKRPFRISVAWGLCQLVGLEEKSRPQGATVKVCQEKRNSIYISQECPCHLRVPIPIMIYFVVIHIFINPKSNLLSGDRDRIEVVGHSIKSRVETILVWIEVENFYPTSISQLRYSINESNAQSRVVSSVTQDIIQQTNAQSGLGRDCPAIKPLACIRAETIQLVCTPSTSNARSEVETVYFLTVHQGLSSN